MAVTVMGLDLSITATGIIVLRYNKLNNKTKLLFESCPLTKPIDRPTREVGLAENRTFYGDEAARIEWIRQAISRAWKKYLPARVGIEGHAFAMKGRGVSILHELHGVVKNDLFRKSALTVPLPPTEVKFYATGNGRAGKDEMIAAAAKAGFRTSNDNLADAFWIARKVADLKVVRA